MDLEELVVGVRKPDLGELKELKIKVTVRLLVNLHYVKLTQSRGISEIVNEALTEYFATLGTGRGKGLGAHAPAGETMSTTPTIALRAAPAPS